MNDQTLQLEALYRQAVQLQSNPAGGPAACARIEKLEGEWADACCDL